MKNWQIVVLLMLCLVIPSITACKSSGSNGVTSAQQLVKVVRGNLAVTVSGSGKIAVSQDQKLTFGSGGRVEKIFISEGDRVTEGEELAKLDTDALELALAKAQAGSVQARLAVEQVKVAKAQVELAIEQAKVAMAQANVARDQAIFNLFQLEQFLTTPPEKLNLARSELEVAHNQLDVTKLQLEVTQTQLGLAELQLEASLLQSGVAEQSVAEAQKQLDRATITAPFAGVVANVEVKEGDTVSASATIIYLINSNSMELEAEVDEIDIPSVKLGQRTIINVDALPGFKLEGRVSSISQVPVMQAGVVTYDVTTSFDAPEDSDLKVGMSATADIIVKERDSVLLVPSRAITHDSQGNTVVQVIVGEQIQGKDIVIGISDGLQTEILSGLAEGDVVVIETPPKTQSSGSSGFLFGG